MIRVSGDDLMLVSNIDPDMVEDLEGTVDWSDGTGEEYAP